MRIWVKGIRIDGIRWTGRCVCLPFRYKVLGLRLLQTIRPPAIFSFQQIRYPAPDEAPAGNSGVLDFIPAIIAGLPPLAGFPQLAAQTFRAVIQTAPEEQFRNRLALLFRFLFYRFLFLDFCDSFTSRTRKGPLLRPFSPYYCAAPPCSENFVDISWYSRVFFGKLFINGTIVLPHLMSPRPKSTLVIYES